jgi:hypothetical protein
MKRTPGVNGVAVLRIPEQVCPTCLLELLRHDKEEGARLLRDPNWRQMAAHSLAVGIIAYAGGSVPQPKTEEDDDVYIADKGKACGVPAFVTKAMKCYLDFTPQLGPSKIRLSFARDNGDKCAPKDIKNIDISAETSYRMEVGGAWKLGDLGGVTVKVEVLDGSPVVITRKQTLG